MTTATKRRSGGPKNAAGITIPYGELKRALAIVGNAVPSRPALPILGNVLFAEGLVTGTDLEMRIETPIDYDGQPMLLPHDRLTQIVNAAGSVEEVDVSVDGTSATIRAGNGSWRLPTEDPLEYPSRATSGWNLIGRLPCDQFRELVNTVRFATDNESSRYALSAVNIEYERDGGKLYFIATDGRRMAIAECGLGENQDPDGSSTLAPRRAIDTLVRLCSGEDELELRRTITGSELIAVVDGTTLYARLVEGRFPRWRDVDVEHKTPPASVIVGTLLHACSMAAVCTSEESKGTDWAFSDSLTISGRSSVNGESSATCDLVEAGHPTTVKLDPGFVIEWLRTLDAAQTITVQAKDSESAVVFRAGDCRQIVMPMAKDA